MKKAIFTLMILFSFNASASDFDAAALEACRSLQSNALTQINLLQRIAAGIQNQAELNQAMDKIEGLQSFIVIQKKMCETLVLKKF